MMRKSGYINTITSLLMIGILAGCAGGTAILDLNGRLIDLYGQEITAQKELSGQNGDHAALTLEAIKSQYLEIMNQAANAAPNQLRAKPAISLYRIAATAAWRAGDGRVTKYADKGLNLCRADQVKAKGQAPRDCAMLVSFPHFAAHDAIFDTLQDFRAKRITDGRKAQELTDTFLNRIRDIRGVRESIRQNSRLTALFDERIKKMSCNAWGAFHYAFNLSPESDVDKIKALENRLKTTTRMSYAAGCGKYRNG